MLKVVSKVHLLPYTRVYGLCRGGCFGAFVFLCCIEFFFD